MISDLCKNCFHFPVCTRYNLFTQPVVYCDDFAHADKRGFVNYSNELQGLCKSCRNRYTCVIEKPVSGVWHCEAYA